jgi:hypothetical protein
MIVPLSIAGDISTASTRRFLLRSLRDPLLDCFPQKDNPNRRIFKRAKLSTLVVTGQVSSRQLSDRNPVTTRVFPGNSLDDPSLDNCIQVGDCAAIDNVVEPVPLTDAAQMELCVRLHRRSDTRRLGAMSDSYVIARREINQTTYRRFISSDASSARMLKGVEVGPFALNTTLSQGQREWLDSTRFHSEFPRRASPPPLRIATQRITGVDERQRIVAAIIEQPMYFADSTNSVIPVPGATHDLDYLVGLLNSDLFQWRFRLTSTNNNVGTNELEALPFRVINFDSPEDLAALESIRQVSRRIRLTKGDLAGTRSPGAADSYRRRIEQDTARLNEVVYRLYELTPADIALIELRLSAPLLVIDEGQAP